MKTTYLNDIGLKVVSAIAMPDGGRIVLAAPNRPHWQDIEQANHNVFRLAYRGEVMWRIERLEDPVAMPWPVRHAFAREQHARGCKSLPYSAEGFLDPFRALELQAAHPLMGMPLTTWHPGDVLRVTSFWWHYDLNVESGRATCAGERLRTAA